MATDDLLRCFNPCSSGSTSQINLGRVDKYKTTGFNPYSSRSTSQIIFIRNFLSHFVLILVLAETSLRLKSKLQQPVPSPLF